MTNKATRLYKAYANLHDVKRLIPNNSSTYGSHSILFKEYPVLWFTLKCLP